MKKFLKLLGILLLIILLVISALGFYLVKNYGANFGIYLGKPDAKTYVEQAIRFMDQGIYAGESEWQEEKARMLEAAEELTSYEECQELIEAGLKVCGGKHSRLLRESGKTSVNEPVQVSINENGVVIIQLPAFMDGSKEEMDSYVNTVRDFLFVHTDCTGVIVDLRGNTGGDSGPMLAAVAPLLPTGTLLSFDISGVSREVVLSDTQVSGSGSQVSFTAFDFPQLPVAVLQDDMTASSGEVVLLAFRGLSYSRSFGSPSAGYASCNNVYALYDGCRMLVTIGKDVARTGEVFCEDPIEPDEYSEDPEVSALAWILEQ